MSTSTLAALLAPLVLCCLGPQPTSPEKPATEDRYVIHCEVWSASDPGLVRQIEALAPTAAEAVLESLRGAERGVQRLARVLSPIDVGSQTQFESQREFATVTVTQSGTATQTGFGGYTSTGTVVTLGCSAGSKAGSVQTALSLNVAGVVDGESPSPQGTPPDRQSIEVRCSGTSTSGELCMYQFQTSEPGTLVVFLRATAF